MDSAFPQLVNPVNPSSEPWRIAQRLALVRRLWQEAKRFVGAARLKMLQ